jgi:preprotein translocase subunit YajC
MEAIFFLTIALLVIAAYYSLVVMPRQSAFRKHHKYVTSLEVGNDVITSGGLIGTITELDVEVGVAKIKFAEGFEVRIIAAAIIQAYNPEEIARNAKLGLGIPESEEL